MNFRKLTIDELNRASIEEYKAQNKYPVIAVLDNVRSMNNVGSAFRTADALNISEVLLLGITPRPPHRDIHKTALGATESVDWKYFATNEELLAYLKEKNCKICAVEQTENKELLNNTEFKVDEPLALIFGNEAKGVNDDLLAECDQAIEIPQFGTKHSLNVSVSIGIVLWHYVQSVLK